MAPTPDPHQINDFPIDTSSRYVSCQPNDHALQNTWAPPVPPNGQFGGYREDIPPPTRGISGPGRTQDLRHVDVGYQGIIDYHPQPTTNPAYVFPNAGNAQGVPVQLQPSAPVNEELDVFGYFSQHVAPCPFPFVHQNCTSNRHRAKNLRQLAIRYSDNPDALVRMVCSEEGTSGLVVIILETPNVP